jgi:hypothetical protein
MSFGVILHGEKGTLCSTRTAGTSATARSEGAERPGHGEGPPEELHRRDPGDAKPNADIEEGHKSTRLCHLGNIAFRTGKVLTFDAQTETTDSPEANQLLGREYRKGFELPAV